MMNLQVQGLEVTLADFRKFELLFESSRPKVLAYAAIPLIDAIKQRAPVGKREHVRYKKRRSRRSGHGQGLVAARYMPGNLRGSTMVLTKLKRNGAVYVGPKVTAGGGKFGGSRFDAFYAHMVEGGTKHSAAQPFVQPGINAAASQVRRRIELGYANAVKKYTTT